MTVIFYVVMKMNGNRKRRERRAAARRWEDLYSDTCLVGDIVYRCVKQELWREREVSEADIMVLLLPTCLNKTHL